MFLCNLSLSSERLHPGVSKIEAWRGVWRLIQYVICDILFSIALFPRTTCWMAQTEFVCVCIVLIMLRRRRSTMVSPVFTADKATATKDGDREWYWEKVRKSEDKIDRERMRIDKVKNTTKNVTRNQPRKMLLINYHYSMLTTHYSLRYSPTYSPTCLLTHLLTYPCGTF